MAYSRYPRYPRGKKYARRRLSRYRFQTYRSPKLRGQFGNKLRGG